MAGYQVHFLATVARRFGFLALDLGDGQAHPAHRAAVVDGDLNEICLVRLRRDGTGKQPHHPNTERQNGGTHRDGDQQVQETYILSMMRALAMPPPSHMVCSP